MMASAEVRLVAERLEGQEASPLNDRSRMICSTPLLGIGQACIRPENGGPIPERIDRACIITPQVITLLYNF